MCSLKAHRVARYLVSRGANLDVASRLSGSTALHLACSSRGAAPEFVSVLVSAGANVNAEDEDEVRPLGRIILDAAANQMHHVEIVKILLDQAQRWILFMAMIPKTTFCGIVEAILRSMASTSTAIENIVASVRRHGSWKAHCRAGHRQILRIRSLVAHGRAKLLARDAGARAAATRGRSAPSSSSFARATMVLCGGNRLLEGDRVACKNEPP